MSEINIREAEDKLDRLVSEYITGGEDSKLLEVVKFLERSGRNISTPASVLRNILSTVKTLSNKLKNKELTSEGALVKLVVTLKHLKERRKDDKYIGYLYGAVSKAVKGNDGISAQDLLDRVEKVLEVMVAYGKGD